MFLCRHSTRKRGLKEPRSVRLNYIRNLPYIISEKHPRDTLIRIFFSIWMLKVLNDSTTFHRLGNFLERNASLSCFQDFVFLWVPVVFHTQIYLRTHNLSIQIVRNTAFLQKKDRIHIILDFENRNYMNTVIGRIACQLCHSVIYKNSRRKTRRSTLRISSRNRCGKSSGGSCRRRCRCFRR